MPENQVPEDPNVSVWNPARVVALLTPIFASLAGAIGAWVADNIPGGPSLDEGELTAAFVAVALSATAATWNWVKGWQKHESREFALEQGIQLEVLSPEHGGPE